MAKLGLDRALLSKIAQGNHQAIVALERVFGDVGGVLPTTIEEAAAQANQAIAMAAQALSMNAQLLAAIEALETAPAREQITLPDDTAPAVQLGSIAAQNADNVEVTGGAVNGTTVGLLAAADAMFKKISASDQITSTLADGIAPLVVTSTTRVANLSVANAGTADSLASPTTFPAAATDLPTVITLANALRAAAISKGL
jgi:hypothetical protein